CARRARASSALRARRPAPTASPGLRVRSWSACLSRPRRGAVQCYCLDCIHNSLITGAATVVACDMLADGVAARHDAAGEQFMRPDQHAGRAEAALQCVAALERLLQIGNRA